MEQYPSAGNRCSTIRSSADAWPSAATCSTPLRMNPSFRSRVEGNRHASRLSRAKHPPWQTPRTT
eukprot:7176082-Pyramimonas_sp.AAC.1